MRRHQPHDRRVAVDRRAQRLHPERHAHQHAQEEGERQGEAGRHRPRHRQGLSAVSPGCPRANAGCSQCTRKLGRRTSAQQQRECRGHDAPARGQRETALTPGDERGRRQQEHDRHDRHAIAVEAVRRDVDEVVVPEEQDEQQRAPLPRQQREAEHEEREHHEVRRQHHDRDRHRDRRPHRSVRAALHVDDGHALRFPEHRHLLVAASPRSTRAGGRGSPAQAHRAGRSGTARCGPARPRRGRTPPGA